MTNKEKLDELFDLYSKGLISKIDLANSIKAINEVEQKDTIEIDEDILNNDLYKTDEARKLAQESRNKAKELKERQAQRDADRLENEAKVKHEEELKAIHKELSDDRNIMIDILSSLKNRVTDEPIYSLRSLQHMPIKELLKLYNDMEFNAPSTLKQAIDKLGYTEWAEKKLAKENDEVSENSMNDEAVSKKSEESAIEEFKKVQDAISDHKDEQSVDDFVKGVQGAVGEAYEQQLKEREVIPDKNNSEPAEVADDSKTVSSEIEGTTELAGEEAVEYQPEQEELKNDDLNELNAATAEAEKGTSVRENAPEEHKSITEKAQSKFEGFKGVFADLTAEGRKKVKSIAISGAVLASAIGVTAALVSGGVLAPVAAGIVNVATTGGVIWGAREFNKVRNGK